MYIHMFTLFLLKRSTPSPLLALLFIHAAKVSGFSATFAHEPYIGDPRLLGGRLAHVVHRQRSHGASGEGLHLHPRLASRPGAGCDLDATRALFQRAIHSHLIQHQVVAQRDQVRGLLRGLYACNLRNRENVPLLHLVRCHHFVHMRLKHNPRACFRDPRRVFLPTHVDHIALPPLVHMSQSLTRCHARLFHDPRLDHRADPGILLHLSHRSSAPLPELLPKDLLKLVIDLTHFTASSTTTTTFLADPSRPTRRLPKVARDRDEEILPECRGRLPACLPHSRRAHPSD
mmetsp:Transcript_13748/g.38731  ORF Transcript_13748/g.38731 Transcript_13748/m.38731 type:complete len:288 (-) Transcript_13748:33-896(-)